MSPWGRTTARECFWKFASLDLQAPMLGTDLAMDDRVQGVRYFTCQPNFGVFVRHDRVKIGDFPVDNIDFSDEEM